MAFFHSSGPVLFLWVSPLPPPPRRHLQAGEGSTLAVALCPRVALKPPVGVGGVQRDLAPVVIVIRIGPGVSVDVQGADTVTGPGTSVGLIPKVVIQHGSFGAVRQNGIGQTLPGFRGEFMCRTPARAAARRQ